MPHRFALKLKGEGCDDLVLRGELSDAEQGALSCYLEQYAQLADSKPLREGFPCEYSMKWAEGRGLETTATLPDNDTLAVLLHRLRPFVLRNEPASFMTTTAIIGKQVGDPHVRHLLREQRELFDGRRSQQMLKIEANSVVVNSERVLADWLNSHEYHRDADKRESIEALFNGMPSDFTRAILVSLLVDKVRAIRNIASLTAVLLGKSESLEFRAPGARGTLE